MAGAGRPRQRAVCVGAAYVLPLAPCDLVHCPKLKLAFVEAAETCAAHVVARLPRRDGGREAAPGAGVAFVSRR